MNLFIALLIISYLCIVCIFHSASIVFQGHSLLAGFHTLPTLAEVLQLTAMFSGFFIHVFYFSPVLAAWLSVFSPCECLCGNCGPDDAMVAGTPNNWF